MEEKDFLEKQDMRKRRGGTELIERLAVFSLGHNMEIF